MLLAVATVAACGGARAHDRGPTDPDDPQVRAWGVGPDPNGSVTLQPDVVVVEGGARAIRGVTDGGLTWHLDPDAGGADRLEVGSVMFVTSDAIGRVLRLRRQGDDLLVTIGPVTLVDVIRDGTFQGTDVPVELAYPRPEPDRPLPVATATDPATVRSSARRGAGPSPPEVQPEVRLVGLNRPTPGPGPGRGGSVGPGPRATGFGSGACCANGAEVRFGYEGNGTRFAGTVALTMKQLPRLNFVLQIKGGRLLRAEISVSGGLGLHLDFAAGTNTGANQTIDIPVAGSFSVPLGSIGPVPLSMKISQNVILKTAFGTKVGEMHARGDYTLASSIGFQYSGGAFTPRNSSNFHRTTSLIGQMGSVAPGVMAVLVKHVVHFNLGFNTALLEAGLYIDVESTVGVTAGSGAGAVALLGAGFVQCRGAGLGVYATVGVGFRILGFVADAVNAFLSLIDIPPIPSRIGPPPLRAYIYRNTDVDPADTQLCGRPGGLGGLVQDGGSYDDGHADLNGDRDPEPIVPGRDAGGSGGSGRSGGSGGSSGGSGGGGGGDQPSRSPGRGSGGRVDHEQL